MALLLKVHNLMIKISYMFIRLSSLKLFFTNSVQFTAARHKKESWKGVEVKNMDSGARLSGFKFHSALS